MLSIFAVVYLSTGVSPIKAQEVNNSDPSELFLKAFTSVQQGEKLETDGRLKPALAKYRFATSLLEQLSQTNPNWQPLIVQYRVRKTTENIRKLEEKISLQPTAPDPSQSGGPTVSVGRNNARLPTANDPVEDDPLPSPDEPPGKNGGQQRYLSAPPQPSTESLDRTAVDLRAKLDKTQKDLNDALNQLSVAQKEKRQALHDKQDIEFQLHSTRSGAVAALKRFERTKADRDDLQTQVDKAEVKLKEAQAKNPGATETRKALRDQVAELKQSLAKAQASSEAAAKAKEELEKRVAENESNNAKLAKEHEAVPANGDLSKEAVAKLQGLEAENAILTQKLSAADASIAELRAESSKKKEELDGVRKELGTLKDQLIASRDQNDRSATTITELRKQLDDNAEQLTQLKAKGITSEDAARMTKENELLRSIVLRQLKDQARRDAARELLKNELARLEVQSKTLNDQVEILGRPAVQLSDEERALFKDPQVSIADNSADPATMAATITAIRPRNPSAAGAAEPDQPSAGASTDSPAPGSSPAVAAANGASLASSPGPTAPRVETTSKPKVDEALVPLAREAEEDFHGGRYPEAEKAYEKLLAREPKNAYLLSNQGVVLLKQDKLKSAEVMLRKASTTAPKDAFPQVTLGIVYYRMHRYDEAITSLTQAIQLDPKNATAHNYLGITSSQKGWPEAATDEIQKAIALNPNYADAHFNLAVIYATNQPPAKDRAEEHYKIATSLGATPDPALEKLIRN